jgi:hypothetical protein
MKATRHPFVLSVIVLCFAGLVCMAPVPARAGGDDNDAPTAKPRPDRAKKIYTNDDFQRPAALPIAAPSPAPAEFQSEPVARTPRARTQAGPYIPEKDPQWYAQQVNSLDEELARVDADAQHLRQFWNNGYAPATGLILNGPCEGVGTNNRIAHLEDRRRELASQIDALEDSARVNGLTPGIFVQPSELIRASGSQAHVRPEAQRAALRGQLEHANAELAETQGIVTGMEADTSARSMTLLQPAGAGANFTTDLLQRLNGRAAAVESQISNVEDEARRAGVQPGFLR